MATNLRYGYASYELAGPKVLSQRDVAALINFMLASHIRGAFSLEQMDQMGSFN